MFNDLGLNFDQMETEKTKKVLIYGMLSLIIIILFSTVFYGNPKQVTGKSFFENNMVEHSKFQQSTLAPKQNFLLNFFRKTSRLIIFKKKEPIQNVVNIPIKIKNTPPNSPAINISIQMGDSDGGVMIYNYGVCCDNERILKDHCDLINKKILFEGYEINQSNKSICVQTSIFCKYGCDNGICLNKTISPNVLNIEINDKAKEIIKKV
jgi:hypothetical protein